jgi:NADPH oxidase
MYTQSGGFTGHVMLLIMFMIHTSAHTTIRNQFLEAFHYTHHLALLFLLGLYTHASGCFVRGALPGQPVQCLGYDSWHWAIWGGGAYLVERIIRETRSRRHTKVASIEMHPSGVIELRFIKPSLRYRAGQWLFLNIGAISRTQWHPFTISSAPDDPYISCHIRQVGDWKRSVDACRLPTT